MSDEPRMVNLTDLEKRLGRIRDIKWFMTLVVGTFGAMITIVAIIASYLLTCNFNEEKNRFEGRLKEQNENLNFQINRIDALFKEMRESSSKLRDDTKFDADKLRGELISSVGSVRSDIVSSVANDADKQRKDREQFEIHIKELIGQATSDAKLELQAGKSRAVSKSGRCGKGRKTTT
jgi:hypothetical protein